MCWVPYMAAHIWMVFVKPPANSDEDTMPYILEFSVMFVALSNSFINPIVILLTNRDYKRKIRQILYIRCGCFEESIMDERSDADSSDTQKKSDIPIQNIFEICKPDLEVMNAKRLAKRSESCTSTTTIDIIADVVEYETSLCDINENKSHPDANVPDLVMK